MKLKWPLKLLLAVLSGLLGSISFRSHDASPLYGLAIGLLIVLTLQESRRLAAVVGFCFGVAFHGASLPWVNTVMRVHGHLDAIPAAGVLALLVAYLALFPAMFSFGLAVQARRGKGRALLTAPFLWVALEFAQTHAPIFGFPWNLAGYSLVQATGLVQLAAVTGIFGLSFLATSCGALIAWVLPQEKGQPWRRPRVILAGSVLAGLTVISGLGSLLLPAPKADRVAALVQTNFPQAPEYPAN